MSAIEQLMAELAGRERAVADHVAGAAPTSMENQLDRILLRRAELATTGFGSPPPPTPNPSGDGPGLPVAVAFVAVAGVAILGVSLAVAAGADDSSEAASRTVSADTARVTPDAAPATTEVADVSAASEVANDPAVEVSTSTLPGFVLDTNTADPTATPPNTTVDPDVVEPTVATNATLPVDVAAPTTIGSTALSVPPTSDASPPPPPPGTPVNPACSAPGSAAPGATAVISGSVDVEGDGQADTIHLYAAESGPVLTVDYAGGGGGALSTPLPAKPVGDLTDGARIVAVPAGETGTQLIVVIDDLDDGETFWATVVGLDGCQPVALPIVLDGFEPFNGVSFLDGDRPVGLLCDAANPSAPLSYAPFDGVGASFTFDPNGPELVVSGPENPAAVGCWQ